MLRQCVSITLVLSLIALGSSGILMIILNSFSFQLQMHPVHKIFGIIMVIALYDPLSITPFYNVKPGQLCLVCLLVTPFLIPGNIQYRESCP